MEEENGSWRKARRRHEAQQQQQQQQQQDRLSSLSDEVLHRIMSLLSLQNAVGTCALSRRWRYLWRTLPYLDFHLSAYKSERANKDTHTQLEEEEYFEANGWSFSNFIMQFLVRRCSSAHLVRVRFDSRAKMNYSFTEFIVDDSVIESLICYAIEHHVQDLDIRAACPKYICIMFPTCFTACQLLTTLKLDFVYVDGKYDYSYTFDMNKLIFPALQSLHLARFHAMDQHFFPRVFSTSPNLQNLKLVDTQFDALDCLSIQAPNLKSLEFTYTTSDDGPFYPPGFKVKLDTPNLTRFLFRAYANPIWCSGYNLSSLDQVDFNVDRNDFVEEEHQHEHSLGSVNPLNMFTHAKTLTLSTRTIKALFGLPSLVESQLQFPNLKSLKITVNTKCDFQIPTSLLNKFLSNSTILKIGQW